MHHIHQTLHIKTYGVPVHATIVDLKLCDGIDPNDLWIARLGHSDGLISTISLKFVPYTTSNSSVGCCYIPN